MALYHFTSKVVSRSKGQSAVHTAAYNAREQLHDERHDRDTKDYGYKGKTEFSGIFAPKDAPAWVHDREQLWNRAEAAENRKDSQTARSVEFALPRELDAEQRRRLVTDFVRETFSRPGMVADVNIHAPHRGNDDRNYHVHCLLTMRRLDGENFAAKKETQWNNKEDYAQWREKWAHMGARALERAGHQQEADRFQHGHKNLAGQQEAALARGDTAWAEHCDREAQIHKGAAVSAMEQKQDPRLADNEIAREAAAIDNRNAARAEIRVSEKELAAMRQEAEKERQPEPEKAQPKDERWQRRGITDMEKEISATHDIAAFRDGQMFRGMLYEKGILLARVDVAGIEAKDEQYRREFENDKLQDIRRGTSDAWQRHTQVQDGELVAVTKSGDVFRLNPNFVDRDALTKAYQSSGFETWKLSEGLEHFADARQQDKADMHAQQHMRYDTRDANRQQRNLAQHIKAGVRDGISDHSGKDTGVKVVNFKGAVESLGSFVESLFGMGTKRPPMTEQQQQALALSALENIADSVEAGENLKAADVANLLPTHLDQLRRNGNSAMRLMISELEQYRKDERDRENERSLER